MYIFGHGDNQWNRTCEKVKKKTVEIRENSTKSIENRLYWLKSKEKIERK